MKAPALGFEVAKLERIISVTVPDNVASRQVMRKCGLTFGEPSTGVASPSSGTRLIASGDSEGPRAPRGTSHATPAR